MASNLVTRAASIRELNRRPWTAGLILAWWISTPIQAQPPGGSTFRPDASVTAELLLRNAETHAAAGHWNEAIAIYQRVLAEHGRSVARMPKPDPPTGSDLYVDVRWDIQRRIASLPPEGLAVYRRLVDPQAERWYREGTRERDPAKLRRIVEEAFCGSWSDDALDWLGDEAFRKGRFAEALTHFRRLAPDPAGPSAELLVPDPDVDLARVSAKILLCRVAQGEPLGARVLEAFADRFPNAEGSLAGRTGPYLRSVLEASRADGLSSTVLNDSRWPTFAGAPTRTKIPPTPIDVGSLHWTIPLEPVSPQRESGPLVVNRFAPPRPPRPGAGLAYHPIVLGDQIVVSESERVIAYNLAQGETAPTEDRPTPQPAEPPVAWTQRLTSGTFGSARTRTLGDPPRFTLTASGDRIYARLGPSHPRLGPSSLLAIRNNREVEGKLQWMIRASDIPLPAPRNGSSSLATFEGSPVTNDQGVYVGITEVATMLTTYVACLDAETGRPRWVRYVGEASVPLDNMTGMADARDIGNRLLALDGATLYYQTNLGALAALDAETGSLRWLATYPTTGGFADRVDRELNPAIVHGGLVYVAPVDCPEILAFDAASGRIVWKSRGLAEVRHLLGVAKGRLIATGDRVWSLDARTGEVLRYWPDAGSGFQGFGRGLLAGDFIYWPTKTEIHVLEQATGLQADRGPIALQQAYGVGGGNLAVGDGYLVVAQEDRLVVLYQNTRLIDRYREVIAAAPGKADNYLRLARVAEAVGQLDLALESLEGAIARASPSETIDGQLLLEMARSRRYTILTRLGDESLREGRWADAIGRFSLAIDAGASDRDVLTARLKTAEAHRLNGDNATAVDQLQSILTEPRFRALSVPDDLRSVRADRLVADRLNALVSGDGRGLYARYDERARDLLRRGREERNPHLLAEIGVSYPVAEVASEALLALGALREQDGEPAEAARAYRKLLATEVDGLTQARALLGLAQAYEAQGLEVTARETYARARGRFGALSLDGESRTVRELVDSRLATMAFGDLGGTVGEPSLPMPLARAWSSRWSGVARPLRAEGLPPSAEASSIFLASRTELKPIDVHSGEAVWTADLGGEPTWVAYLADRLVAATRDRLVALDLREGSILWSFDAGDPLAGRAKPNPFARDAADPPRREATLSGLRIVGGRIYGFRGDQELLAIDGDSGLLDWSYTPTRGTLNPHFRADLERLVIQVRDPNAIVVLDPANGRHRAEFPQTDGERPWARDPLPIDADAVALVIEPRSIILFDLQAGGEIWSYREPAVLPKGGAPRLIGDGGRLLVIRDGSELVRLDAETGQKLWSRVLGIEDLSEFDDALVLDDERVYCAIGPNAALTAYDLADGSVAWRRHLIGPAAGWSLALAEGLLVAYPDPSRSVDGEFPNLPVIFARREDGRLVQRLLFQAAVSELAVRLSPRSTVIATQAQGWALGPRASVDGGAASE